MERAGIEARVGAFVLAALVVLVGFVLALGDFSLSRGTRLYGDFAYTGGLQEGAPVMVSGVRIGRVTELALLGASAAPAPAAPVPGVGRSAPALVRASLEIDDEARRLIGPDALLYIGTQGLIGESYVEVAPGPGSATAVEAGAVLRGVDAPRLHVMMLQFSTVLGALGALVGSDDEVDLGAFGEALGRLLGTVNELVGERKAELGVALGDVAASMGELREILRGVRNALGDGQVVGELVTDAAASAAVLENELPGLLRQARESLARIEELSVQAREAVDPAAVEAIVADARATAKNLEAMSADAQALARSIRRGQGTVGGLIADPQVYDDLKEMLRDLKRHPWKFLWRD